MTDKSAASVREFAERIFPLTDNEEFYNTLQESFRKELIEGVTAIIEEHCYPKEFIEWMLRHGAYSDVPSESFTQKWNVCIETNEWQYFTTDELYQYWKENVR